ncbi:MAG: hypothetical protein EU548_09990, partial [Promethearchaeota archaeon]
MKKKPTVLFTSNVFTPEEIGNNKIIEQGLRVSIKNLWRQLEQIAQIKIFDGRFPEKTEIQSLVHQFKPLIIGCHLSHPISAKIVESPDLIAVSTATVGYNHIKIPENNDVLITHTPGVLHEAVAD